MNILYELQLLRPLWLLGLLPVAILLWLAWRVKQKDQAWQEVIAPQFYQLLLGQNASRQDKKTSHLTLLSVGLLWLLSIIALSGPSIKSVEIPLQKNHQGSVIILDLSLSMLADDISPNRLERVKYKITDLLKAHPEYAVGLVGYAASAHMITPISEDNHTLLGILPALNPVIMPSFGSDPLKAFEQAKQLLTGAFINQGHIIWVTDSLESNQVKALTAWIQQNKYSVSILAVGSEQGGVVQIPNYGLLKDAQNRVVQPRLSIERLQTLASQTQSKIVTLSLADDDLSALLPPNVINQSTNAEEQNSVVHALDEGAWLALLILPFIALGYRRGALFSVALTSLLTAGLMSSVFLVGVGYTMPLMAETQTHVKIELPSLSRVFQSPNQQGYQAWLNGQYEIAELLFEDSQWRAAALYKLKKYQKAAQFFAQDNSATGHYNRGNALAKSGDFAAAKQAYEAAIKLQQIYPAAQTNLAIMEQLLKKQDTKQATKKQPQNQSPKPQPENKSQPSEADVSALQENKQQSMAKKSANLESGGKENAQAQLDKQDETSPLEQEMASEKFTGTKKAIKDQQDTALENPAESLNNLPSIEHKTHQAGQPKEKTQLEKEQSRSVHNWLQQIPDQPGLFLKRKFEYQFKKQAPSPIILNNTQQKQW